MGDYPYHKNEISFIHFSYMFEDIVLGVRIVGGQSGQSFGHLVELKIEGRCSNKIKTGVKISIILYCENKNRTRRKILFLFFK